MVKIVGSFEVNDWVHWKKTFDAHSEAREKANIKSIYVGNELENNNKVHIVMETPEVDTMQKFMQEPLNQELIKQSNSEVRQAFESCGYSSVGWTYPYNNHAMQSQGLHEEPYTCWADGGATLIGVAGTLLGGMSHSVISINGPWNSPTVSGTDPSDKNDAVWRCARFYFRYVGDSSSLKMPLPITGMHSPCPALFNLVCKLKAKPMPPSSNSF